MFKEFFSLELPSMVLQTETNTRCQNWRTQSSHLTTKRIDKSQRKKKGDDYLIKNEILELSVFCCSGRSDMLQRRERLRCYLRSGRRRGLRDIEGNLLSVYITDSSTLICLSLMVISLSTVSSP